MTSKRAVVTGGGSGLGRAFCVELASQGYSIVISDINMGGAEETATLAREKGATVFVERCDVTVLSDVERLRDRAEQLMGGTDLIINNAGVAVGGAVDEVTMEDWKWVMDINLWGVIHGVHAFVPAMKRRGSGAVINIASLAGLVHAPALGPYNVTKAGVVALSETLYAEVKESGVRVTVVCPTFFRTGIIDEARGPMDPKDKAVAGKMMDKASVQADGVARHALKASDRGELHALPMLDGRMFWRAKRSNPGMFQKTIIKVMKSKFMEKLQS